MTKSAPLLFNAGSGLIILASFDSGPALLRLFLVGEVPGTEIVIPASVMLFIFALCALAILGLYLFGFVRSMRASHNLAKLQKLPKRRFAQTI